MNEKQFSLNYKTSMAKIRGTDEEKLRATSLINKDQSLIRKTIIKRRIPGIAAIVVAFVSIFTLGGFTVWAMTNNFSFRDFFFENSEKEFEDVYSDAHKEHMIGGYKIVCEGYIYDESVGQGLLNFSIWDAQGLPVESSDNVSIQTVDMEYSECTNQNSAFKLEIGKDEVYLFLNNVDNVSTFLSDNSLFVTVSRMELYEPFFKRFGYKYLKYLLLDKDEYMDLKKELDALDEDAMYQDNFAIDYSLAQSEVEKVLIKYDLQSVECIPFPAQIIQVEGIKLTIGRTSLIMEYNEKERTIEGFTMIRANGTRIEFELDEHYVDSAGNPTDTRINWIMIVDGVEKKGFIDGIGNLNGDIKLSYNYGFILGKEEKITIEANGKSFQ